MNSDAPLIFHWWIFGIFLEFEIRIFTLSTNAMQDTQK